jgi:RNA polymerase-associated protein
VKKNCPYSHAARIALEEKKVLFRAIEMDGEKDYDEIVSLNPDGILPILKERHHIIYDPEVVMLYIDERYPAPPLLPNYPVDRARIRLAMTRIEREWYSILRLVMTSQDEKEIAVSKIALIDSLKSIEHIFSANEFFMSDTMTLADCSLGALLYSLPLVGINLDSFLREMNNYAQRIFSRDSFQITLPDHENKSHRRR